MKLLSLDIETSGLDPWRDKIYMCGIYDGENYLCIRDPLELKYNLEEEFPDWEITGHRTDFDIKFLQVQGWLPMDLKRQIHDSRIMGSLLKKQVPKEFLTQYEVERKIINKTLPTGVSHRKGSPLSLKVMAPWYLKIPPFWETPGDHNNEQYNELDCLYAYRLKVLLGERLQAEGSWDFYVTRMLEWSKMLRAMEIKGIGISLEALDKIENEQMEKRDRVKIKLDGLWKPAQTAYSELQVNKIRDQYTAMAEAQIAKGKPAGKIHPKYALMFGKAVSKLDTTLNYASPTQMSWLLKDYLGLDIVNPDGEESTGKAVLNRLAQTREDIKTYLEWRKADKLLTMYIPTYKALQVDGIIHPSFNSTGTRTGRLSCSAPNLQQVPPALYEIFRPKEKFINYDLSGIEAALIALYSGDERLYSILEKGESIHDHNVVALAPLFKIDVTGVPMSEIAKKFAWARKIVKSIGFACFYGAGWRRIQQVFAAGGFILTDEEAKLGLKLLKAAYKKAFDFHKEITEVFENGETVLNLLGRPITMQAHDSAYMKGFNTLIQSSASDLNMYACYKWWKMGNDPRLLIHDCIIGEASSENAAVASQSMVMCMTDFNLLSVNGPIQIRAEGGASDKWEK